MVRRSTWILLVIFAILAAFAWWFQTYQADRDEYLPTETPTPARARVFSLSTTQVDEIGISSSDGSQVGFYRDPGTTQWAVRGEPVEQADAFQVEAVIGQLLALEIEETLPGNPALDSIGLAEPQYTITVMDSGGNQYILHVGVQTPIGTGYYAQLRSGEVVVVDNLVMDNVVGLLTNPPLLPTAAPAGTVPAVTPTP